MLVADICVTGKKSNDSQNVASVNVNDSSATLVSDIAGIFEAEPVDSDPFPDIFALGFQELDLSTEALLYSTSSTREDAWCVAAFAALGEKGPLYEKV